MKNPDKINGYALPTVLVVSVLISLIILLSMSLVSMDRQYYALFHRQKQRIMDLHSLAALSMVDSTMMNADSLSGVFLFGSMHPELSISKRKWGLYEVFSFHSSDLPFSITQIVGRKASSFYQSELYVADNNRPLSFAGTTNVDGSIYIPQSGVNYTEFDSEPFSGQKVTDEGLRIASKSLPQIDSAYYHYLDSLAGLKKSAWYYKNIDSGNNSFNNRTNLVYCREQDHSFSLQGNTVLYADKIRIDKSSMLDGVLVMANTAYIQDGFVGRLQLFCSDTVILGKDVHLRYPSGVFVSSWNNNPCVIMHNGSSVDGYVIALNGGREDRAMNNPCLRQEPDVSVCGLLYVDGPACLAGRISGSAYLRDCYYEVSGYKYPGVLYNCCFQRNDNVGYPLIVKGPYRRKAICKVF